MAADPIAPAEKVRQLREALADHYQRTDYLRCETMGSLVTQNLESIRQRLGRPVGNREIETRGLGPGF
jgi:hypothetical protein